MVKRISLSFTLALLTLCPGVQADSLVVLKEGKQVVVQGSIQDETASNVSVKVNDQAEAIKFKTDQVISITRNGFPEPLIEAHKLALAAGNDKEKLTAAADALNKVSRNKKYASWAREYAKRYTINMYFSAGLLKESRETTDDLGNAFPHSRVLLQYFVKIGMLALNEKNTKVLAAVKQNLSAYDQFGTFTAFYYDSYIRFKENKLNDADRKLKNLLNKLLPSLKNPKAPQNIDLKLNCISLYGRTLLALDKRQEAKIQLAKLEKHKSNRAQVLYLSLRADIQKSEGKFRTAYRDYTKALVQFPQEKDIHLHCLINATEIAKTLKYENDVSKLNKQFAKKHPGYKKNK